MRDCAKYTEFLAPEKCPLITKHFMKAAGISDAQDVKLYIGVCKESSVSKQPAVEVLLQIDGHSHELVVCPDRLDNITIGQAIALAYTTNMLNNVGKCDFAL